MAPPAVRVAFAAGYVDLEDQDDFWQVAFVDDFDDVGDFLMLQRAFEHDEQDARLGMNTYYVERNDQRWSCYGGIETFELRRDGAAVRLDAQGRNAIEADRIDITFAVDDKRFRTLVRRLRHVFAGTSCLLEHA